MMGLKSLWHGFNCQKLGAMNGRKLHTVKAFTAFIAAYVPKERFCLNPGKK
jgi:hypothetical protein